MKGWLEAEVIAEGEWAAKQLGARVSRLIRVPRLPGSKNRSDAWRFSKKWRRLQGSTPVTWGYRQKATRYSVEEGLTAVCNDVDPSSVALWNAALEEPL
jgi:hypothetical protein